MTTEMKCIACSQNPSLIAEAPFCLECAKFIAHYVQTAEVTTVSALWRVSASFDSERERVARMRPPDDTPGRIVSGWGGLAVGFAGIDDWDGAIALSARAILMPAPDDLPYQGAAMRILLWRGLNEGIEQSQLRQSLNI